ncbi:hypothetical protein [Clostridium cibarium]|uniref:Uncharacterized protein n=1 Tax=Clostridium cibarium TaxID=2762247 RepID=A0ABR8PZ95_9CLOT|nr:hypothetical protein [Clostridium cibarium]MBD7913476.1 hypothetical protein [Clostridium cibarium]
MIDKANKVLETTEKGLNQKADKVREETEKFISDCEENKKRTNDRYKSFFDRWKWLDFLIIADLLVMPIIMMILAYKVFAK